MRSGGELRAAVGLILLATAAWILPQLRTTFTSRDAPATRVLYSVPDDARLFWSPLEGLSPARPEGTPGNLCRIGGWRGLLLGTPLDLNQADLDDLAALPGIGPRKAAAILELRGERGRFDSVEELWDVPGIGEKTLERLRPRVRVQGETGRPPGI